MYVYANDIVLLAANEDDSQDMMFKLQTFCDQSMMKVITSKTIARWMIFKKSLVLGLEAYLYPFMGTYWKK